ncbi:hypothetical protein [Pontixanthobacter sp.]|uniref:hypothetical protein n=1 Tax=Pontixanthobacter sp. TaxID=2792078 RepID=UPI003C7EBBF9
MNQFDGLNSVYLIACLILAASALTGYKLNWRRGVIYLLMWGSIFVLVTIFISALI